MQINPYTKALESVLTEEDAAWLDKIYEPCAVAVPHECAGATVCVGDDGEIRCYGLLPESDDSDLIGQAVYQSSRDCGLSWKLHEVKPGVFGWGVKSPWSNRRVKVVYHAETHQSAMRITEGGLDSTEFFDVPLEGVNSGCMVCPPLAMRSRKRWIVACSSDHTFVARSDDDGDTWQTVHLPETDHFEIVPPHKGPRWENSGVEPTVAELSDGSLLMFLRTSTDYHYVTRSYDGGETWTRPEPYTFHSTLTMPRLLHLNDGRLLFFYNNTRPLPELDKETVWPPLNRDERTGRYEDVFTNRDANCVCVSEDDGKTWFGFRELHLNPLRNTCDFRSSGGHRWGGDKSVHQFEAIELPRGKVLVHVGQNEMLRRLMIFDVNWLYESGRSEDFHAGMGGLSTHVYLKSVTGNWRGKGFVGHCAWNRTNGAVLVPDPSGNYHEVLLMKNTNDDRLVSDTQGVVWNFPAGHRGEVTVNLRIQGKGLRISLLDHWMNPIDRTVADYAQFSTELKAEDAPADGWSAVKLVYDTDAGQTKIMVNGTVLKTLAMQHTAPNGLCYLHLQTLSDFGDSKGTLIQSLAAEKQA